MTIDRARNSYDPTRDWRAVLAQQGRVTLEADVNEQATIVGEARRREAIDVIGPVGSPDGGYQVSIDSAGTDVLVGPGTLYLGGWRLRLPAAIATAAQPAWLDMPHWPAPTGNQDIALLVTEQTVVAVEDTALQEVALGGPDSAGRLRLLQHVLRLPTNAGTCLDASTVLAAYAAANGQTWNPKTCGLTSNATLLVTPVAAATQGGPCDPPAQGGYLGADNQMIRVAVTQYNPATGQGMLVWGWNNASFLYRAAWSQPNVLTLLADPVDPDHQPQQGQAVEILYCTMDLDAGTPLPSGVNFVAAGAGTVMTLGTGQGYDSTTRRLTLPGNVVADGSRPLFVRLWQAQVAFTAGTAVTLGTTGLSVTIANPPQAGAIGGRPFWQFAVRPSTPAQVYPQRYLAAPQPPDGPRQFLASLGVVGTTAGTGKFSLIANCVPPFLPLTAQPTGCCEVVLGPADVAGRGGLQAVVNSLQGGPASVSLRPGTYTLTAPLVLGPQHAGLVLAGCSCGVTLQAADPAPAAFLAGLIVMQNVANIALRRLDLVAPLVVGAANATGAGPSTLIGIGIAGAQSLTIEDCNFHLDRARAGSFGSGIFAVGTLSGIVIRSTSFGLAHAMGGSAVFGVLALTSAVAAATTLDAVQIADCRFQNLAAGVIGYGQLGLIRCAANVVAGSTAGFYFAEADLGTTNAFVRQSLTVNTSDANAPLAQGIGAAYKTSLMGDLVQQAAPIIASLSPPPTAPTVSSVAQQALASQFAANGSVAWNALTVAPAGAAAAAVPATPTPQVAAARIGPVLQMSTQSLATIDSIALAATTTAPPLNPALRFDANEVTLAATTGAPGVGLAVVLALGGQPSSVMVSGNRVVVPDGNTAACALMFPLAATVTGNIFSQLLPAQANLVSAATLVVLVESFVSVEKRQVGLLQVSGNVVHPTMFVLPAPIPAAGGTWPYFNTVL